jgi:U5 small nuclear ribonucleoprotein component
MIAEPLDPKLGTDLEQGLIDTGLGARQLAEVFQNRYGWDALSARGIWAFGPDERGPNVLVDDTIPGETDKRTLMSVRESVKQGFQWGTREGPLCDEREFFFRLPLCFFCLSLLCSVHWAFFRELNLYDLKIQRSATSSSRFLMQRWRPNQFIAVVVRLSRPPGEFATLPSSWCVGGPLPLDCCSEFFFLIFYIIFFLQSVPRLMEPMYQVEIQAPADCVPAVYTVLARRRYLICLLGFFFEFESSGPFS